MFLKAMKILYWINEIIIPFCEMFRFFFWPLTYKNLLLKCSLLMLYHNTLVFVASYQCLPASSQKQSSSLISPLMLGALPRPILKTVWTWADFAWLTAPWLLLVLFTPAWAELFTPLVCKYWIEWPQQNASKALHLCNQSTKNPATTPAESAFQMST